MKSQAAHASIGVVVLSHDGTQLTLDCLQSLEDAGYANRIDIVVDNGSIDQASENIAARFPAVHNIRLERNVGFSAGNNAGIAHALDAGCDYVLLLNNDTLVERDSISRLVDAAARHPGVGAVSPLLVYADEPDIVWFAGADFDPCSARPSRMHGYREAADDLSLRAGRIGRFTGAAVLVPADVVRSVGMLRDDLFFLFEDVEWSLRMRRAGHQIYLEPTARVRHRVARTQGSEHSLASYYYGVRNQIAVSNELCPRRFRERARRAFLTTAIYAARARRAERPAAAVRASLAGLLDARRGRLGPWRQHG